MITLNRVIVIVFLLLNFIYTISYGIWTFKDKNLLGAIAVILLSLSILIFPIYTMFFRM